MTKTEFYSLQKNDMWFNLVEIVHPIQKDTWHNFIDKTPVKNSSDGVMTFQSSLRFYNNPNTEVWVGYVSDKKITNALEIDSNIEMAVTATTSDNSLFTTHMGIQRLECPNTHSNISISLHAFCAKVMHTKYPEKMYMINTPVSSMRYIMMKACADKHIDLNFFDNKMSDGEYIHYPYITTQRIENIDNKVENITAASKKPTISLLAEQSIIKALYNQRQQIKEGKIFPILQEEKDGDNTGDLYVNNSNGVKVMTITPDMRATEFRWFFDHYDQWSLCTGYADSVMQGVDLSKLSQLDPTIANTELSSGFLEFDITNENIAIIGGMDTSSDLTI